jgi:hypothetical protein
VTVDKDLAERFVRETAWWMTHVSGHPVRAPRHAKRLRESERGWGVGFGANTFEVTVAIERCWVILDRVSAELDAGEAVSRAAVEAELKKAVSNAVSNYRGDLYEHYPVHHDTLQFGAQGIGVDDAAKFMIKEYGLDWRLTK